MAGEGNKGLPAAELSFFVLHEERASDPAIGLEYFFDIELGGVDGDVVDEDGGV